MLIAVLLVTQLHHLLLLILKLQGKLLDGSLQPHSLQVAAFRKLAIQLGYLRLLRLDDALELQLALVKLKVLHVGLNEL